MLQAMLMTVMMIAGMTTTLRMLTSSTRSKGTAPTSVEFDAGAPAGPAVQHRMSRVARPIRLAADPRRGRVTAMSSSALHIELERELVYRKSTGAHRNAPARRWAMLPRARHDEQMTSLTDLVAANRAFADLAARVDADAPVRNDIWSNAGAMIDHLGNIQAWATRIVRDGVPADRKQYRRPPQRSRAEWFRETSDALVETLEMTDAARPCWTIWGAEPVVSFWRRRMTNEAAKHLWDLRTALVADPSMPEEIGAEARAGIMDEFVEVLVPAARAREIAPLPRDVLLVANDLRRSWLFSQEWDVTTTPQFDLMSEVDADVMRADIGDLVLFVWERASPWTQPDRFRIDAGETGLLAFSRTRVHL